MILAAGKFYRNGKPLGQLEGWYCDLIVKEAADWLNARKDPDKPFFLLVCSHEPHTPIDPPSRYSEKFNNEYEPYDLNQDIGQAEDLAGRIPEKIKELSAKLDILWKDIQAEAPIWPNWKAK